jgi:hypothetical protein
MAAAAAAPQSRAYHANFVGTVLKIVPYLLFAGVFVTRF